jgi:hypothetical protein
MSTSRILHRVIIILGCAVFGASVGVCWQALRFTAKPSEFRSLAKLVAGGQVVTSDSPDWRAQQADFYGTIIKTLESAEMKRRAFERVRALNPDLKDADVDIRVVQTKGSAIFNILATGRDPKYTRIFLDALLDEFIAFRQNIREQSGGKALQEFREKLLERAESLQSSFSSGADSVAIQERASVAAEVVEAWQLPIAIGALGGGLLGAIIGLLLSLIIVRSSPPPLPPTA